MRIRTESPHSGQLVQPMGETPAVPRSQVPKRTLKEARLVYLFGCLDGRLYGGRWSCRHGFSRRQRVKDIRGVGCMSQVKRVRVIARATVRSCRGCVVQSRSWSRSPPLSFIHILTLTWTSLCRPGKPAHFSPCFFFSFFHKVPFAPEAGV